jgi:hypothetical protein
MPIAFKSGTRKLWRQVPGIGPRILRATRRNWRAADRSRSWRGPHGRAWPNPLTELNGVLAALVRFRQNHADRFPSPAALADDADGPSLRPEWQAALDRVYGAGADGGGAWRSGVARPDPKLDRKKEGQNGKETVKCSGRASADPQLRVPGRRRWLSCPGMGPSEGRLWLRHDDWRPFIVSAMNPRLWQRHPEEAPAHFTAFVAYLRLKGRRSHRAVAAQTGRPLGAIRRLSVRFNWPGRVAAFEARRAEAAEAAIEASIRPMAGPTSAEYERLQLDMAQFAQRILAESSRWIRLASDGRRRNISLGQVGRIIRLASQLGRLCTGLPTGDEPRGRSRAACGFTGPSVAEALRRIYGSPPHGSPGAAGNPAAGGEVASGASPLARPANVPPLQTGLNVATAQPAAPSSGSSHRRRDAWAAWVRQQRLIASMHGGRQSS